jgi:sugar/nucleoside kinase (ribokinase family)
MRKRKIVTIGEILVEIMATEVGDGFLEPVPLIGPFPSGAPAIFIDQAARFGQPCAIVSAVGRDDFGRVNVERLRADGVDVSGIGTDPERPTGSAFVRYRADGSRDFVFNIRHSACASIRETPEAMQVIAGCDHLHVRGTALFSRAVIDLIRAAITRIRGQGGTVSFDPNIRREMLDLPEMREALEFMFSASDLFMPSGDELYLFTGAREEAAAVRDILGRGRRAVVLKRGAKGASYFDAEGEISVPGFAVEEVDPTGAGDCFGAVFVAAWLQGIEPQRALTLANAAGALAVGRKGPMEGASTRAEIEAFVAARAGAQ